MVKHNSLSLSLGRYVHDLADNFLVLLLLILVDRLVFKLRIEIIKVLIAWINLFKGVEENENVETGQDDGFVEFDKMTELTILTLLAHVPPLSQGILPVMLAFLKLLRECGLPY